VQFCHFTNFFAPIATKSLKSFAAVLLTKSGAQPAEKNHPGLYHLSEPERVPPAAELPPRAVVGEAVPTAAVADR